MSFVAVSLDPTVGANFEVANSAGWDLLANELYVLCAAGLGATFAALFEASWYVTRSAFDPGHSMTYWVRVVLGLTAGTIMALLLSDVVNTEFGQPALAMLGGFSSKAVHGLLARLVTSLEALVNGDGTKARRAETQAAIKALEVDFAARQRELEAAQKVADAQRIARLEAAARADDPTEEIRAIVADARRENDDSVRRS